MPPEIKLFSFPRLLAYGAIICLLLPFIHQAAEIRNSLYGAYLLILGFLISYILMPFFIMLGEKIGLVDQPNEVRKQHNLPTALTGGSVLYLAFIISILLNFHFSVEVKAIIAASTLIFLVGLADDYWGTSALFRLLVQVAASFLLVIYGLHVTFVPSCFGGLFTETVITMLWIIGITNSMNFIDGMDGLAAGSAIIYSLFFALIAILTHQLYMMFMALAIAGSCLGFIVYNFRRNRPAAVFLGDSGSTFLGFLLASFAILGEWGSSIIDIVIPVLIMSVLIFDMTLTTFVRIHSGEVRNFGQWIHYTGRDHFHHRLVDLGISKYQATWLFFGVSIAFGVEALAILFANVLVSILILLHSVLTFAIIGIIIVLQSRKKAVRQA
jgi:UDP-GlcNAc:undecaprenyl-phosphate GlcNAc-1-phosphate transferase